MTTRLRPPSARGFTLIESLAAMAIFTIGVLGVLHLNALASSQNSLAQRESAASKIGRDLTEAFERLPWGHPMLSVSTLTRDSAEFLQVTNSDGLHSLSDTITNARPLLGAAEMAKLVDGSDLYQVYWRTAKQTGADGLEEGVWVAIMVRYRIPVTGGTKQLDFWTFKYNPAALTANQTTARVQEI